MVNTPVLPIPISFISGHYFLFSTDAVTYLRREHNICGVLIGTLPQIPQQNIFLGLPLELMPEEARLLVEKKIAYIVDDAQVHNQGMKTLADEDRRRHLESLEQHGRRAALVQSSKKEHLKEKALKQSKKSKSQTSDASKASSSLQDGQGQSEDLLFSSVDDRTNDPIQSSSAVTSRAVFGVTPADSLALFPKPPPLGGNSLPKVPSSYPLYAHLHSKGYFLSPGLRFGCQYMAYPGDPLRFHSHFLVSASEWDEEINLMDLVVGGRLGTGVKKGYLIGGEIPSDEQEKGTDERTVRTFSLEWAGM
ncbi:tRNA-splicing endonuclease subunit, putative [Coccidioides posadasii C735 delta SOWgp]|uniref:tRNA-splicing endonuclease subunit Sen34 n=2 Tax=Coccidioides posadasii TaxID=199306 RepID=A0A0J6I3B4_COCPO|nr:tRNA-splicing endonuclease subunit, putative [Coccidioides posadasii C735 delta SOWgp]EER24235.1 tRNA-splicing endonuclease subunit, putative [Coccidioides posadasii C735 delta SOWgp]KMM65867.1 tRNA-splicing endonuclease subunit SEN34 [Coccidioides posadasii RMSCC 3488]|eukprot:XP_003066380.1 tRNA-splicing endonuclease subunit, putative [Coccidioides posadasii C735 delta SOWgp]